MLRNIPNKIDQAMLKGIIDETSHGLYDFMYLRIDFANNCNVGYAFINFQDVSSLPQYLETQDYANIPSALGYHQLRAGSCRSEMVCFATNPFLCFWFRVTLMLSRNRYNSDKVAEVSYASKCISCHGLSSLLTTK